MRRLHARRGGAVGNPRVDLHPRIPALRQPVPRHHRLLHRHRHEQVETQRRGRAAEAGRRHTDNREGAAVERDRAADDRGIRGKRAAPETVGDHGDGVAIGDAFFVGAKGPAELRPDAEELEEVRGHELAEDANRLVAGAQVHRHETERHHRGHAVERRRAQVLEVRIRHAQVVARGAGAVDHEDAILARDACQRRKQQRLHPAEDRGVGADAEPEDEDGDHRERGPADEHPPGEFQILQDHAGTPLEGAELQRVRRRAERAGHETHRTRDRAARLALEPDRVVPQLRAPLLAPLTALAGGNDDAEGAHEQQYP